MEGVILVVLAEREAAGDICGLGGVRRGVRKKVVGGEPVVINELLRVSGRDFAGEELLRTLLR